MTLKLTTAVTLIILSTFISCAGTDNNDYIDKSLITPEAEKKAAQQTVATENNIATPNTPVIPGINNVNPGMQANQVNIIPQNNNIQVTPVAATASGKLNPAHGQPGHRCDIAVGAPLDSKPATVQPTTVSTQPGVTMTEVSNQQKTLPGMNPPHGEPGHRCDIAVGAPLNSKPAPATTKVDANAAPVTVNTQPTQQKTLPGMNPPHGEPNHRCDIAVGAPLNSKPVTTTAVQSTAPPALLTPPKADSSKN